MKRANDRIRNLFISGALGVAALGVANIATADSHHSGRQEMRVDDRYNHNRPYPVHGYVYAGLPHGYASVHYHGSPYYYGGGAIIGAIAGGMMGAASDSARHQEAQRINAQGSAEEQAERARLEKQASDYRRAISACLEGRGYTVK